MIQTTNPDAAHPDTWARVCMCKGGRAHHLRRVGLRATTPASVDQDYGQAGNPVVQGGCFIDIADVSDTIVGCSGLAGFHQVPSIPWSYHLDPLANA